MDILFDYIFAIIRNGGDLRAAFDSLREIAKARLPSVPWEKIRTPDVEADVCLAAAWLKENLTEFQPNGVYLGLDTLNENDGDGKNVEIGMTRAANTNVLEMDWAYRLEKYGEDHLIQGMYETHESYRRFDFEFDGAVLVDYLFFFGYSGLVLASAIERTLVNWDCLFIWGFHDGDLAYLAKASCHGVTRLATGG